MDKEWWPLLVWLVFLLVCVGLLIHVHHLKLMLLGPSMDCLSLFASVFCCLSQEEVFWSKSLRRVYRVSLNRFWGPQVFFFPSVNSPKRSCLGRRQSEIWATCPAHCSGVCTNTNTILTQKVHIHKTNKHTHKHTYLYIRVRKL